MKNSRRHRIRNNLPGARNVCPLVRRMPKLEALIEMNLGAKAKNSIGLIHADILSRAAAVQSASILSTPARFTAT